LSHASLSRSRIYLASRQPLAWTAVKEERGKILSADLERFILLTEVSGGSGSEDFFLNFTGMVS